MTSRTSVIMPVRNGEAYIEEAIDSALGQLGPDDEILVVDDASADNTRLALARIPDPRIRIFDGLAGGVSSARNIGLSAAVGDFTAFLDHDDLWPAGRHRTMIQALIADPQLDAVFGRIRIRLEPGGTLWSWMLHQDGRHAPGSNLGNALYRSNALRRIGGFDESLRFGEDLDYFNRLQEKGIRFALCDVDAMIYRRHATNITNDQRRMKSMIFDLIRPRMVRARQLKQHQSDRS
jgi:glycosyltransferase involved in cell wall biosynthesis